MKELIYELRSLVAEWLLERAFDIAPDGNAKSAMADACLTYMAKNKDWPTELRGARE